MICKELDMEFVSLCYSIDSLFGEGNLIDSYSGEIPVFSKNDTSEDLRKRLINFKDKVNSQINDVEPFFEKTYIISHINSLITQLDLFEGKIIDFNVALNSLYDIKSPIVSLSPIEKIHKELDELLTKKGIEKGNLRDRVLTWKKDNSVTTKCFVDLIKKERTRYKKLTFNLINDYVIKDINNIYDVSELDICLTETNQGWGAYNYYLGNYSGKISFNSKAEFNANSVATFISHEAYPGHHTSAMIKEFLLKSKIISNYATLNLLKTPSSLVEEGIGDCGLKILGIKPTNIDEEIEQTLDNLSAEVDYLLSEMVYNKNYSLDTLYDILLNYKFMNDKNDANRSIAFINNWTLYVPIYKLGRYYISNFINNNSIELLKNIYYPSTAKILMGFDNK